LPNHLSLEKLPSFRIGHSGFFWGNSCKGTFRELVSTIKIVADAWKKATWKRSAIGELSTHAATNHPTAAPADPARILR
jgi:hypothetical protein